MNARYSNKAPGFKSRRPAPLPKRVTKAQLLKHIKELAQYADDVEARAERSSSSYSAPAHPPGCMCGSSITRC